MASEQLINSGDISSAADDVPASRDVDAGTATSNGTNEIGVSDEIEKSNDCTDMRDQTSVRPNRGLLTKLHFPKFVNPKRNLLRNSKSVDSMKNVPAPSTSGTITPVRSHGFRRSKSFISPMMTSVTSLLMSPVTTDTNLPNLPLPTSKSSSSFPTSKSVSSLSGKLKSTASDIVSGATKHRKSKSKSKLAFSAVEVVAKFSSIVESVSELTEDCNICCERLQVLSTYSANPDDGHIIRKLARCQHHFHQACLYAMYDSGQKDGSLVCPTCKMIYGEKYGNCPAGRMSIDTVCESLPGYTCDTIRIIYCINPGIQGENHPSPGKPFTARGFPRHCYLPNNAQGRKVVSLLKIAWERRLTFTIGTSATSGEQNTVTWNEIHHKTEFGSNVTGHGYPDENYLDNVMYELAAQGVTEDLLTSN